MFLSPSYVAGTCYNRTDCRIGESLKEDIAVVLRMHDGDVGATAVLVRGRAGHGGARRSHCGLSQPAVALREF